MPGGREEDSESSNWGLPQSSVHGSAQAYGNYGKKLSN